MAFDYDFFVIGGGSGGVRAARIAATHGARVGIAEEYRFGGTCVIRGCVPKKLLVYASRFSEEFDDAAGFGWTLPDAASFSWPDLIAAKDKEITRLEGAYRGNLDRSGVEIFHERAEFVDAHTVQLKTSGKTVTAEKILIATGGRAERLPVEGGEHTITSDEVFHLSEFPKRIVIAGGGYIAVEFAGIFAGLGSEVTLVIRRSKVLRGFDEELRDALMAAYKTHGIKIVDNVSFEKFEKTPTGLSAHLSDGSVLEADEIMQAVGRSPNVTGLGLEAAGVKTDGKRGTILVDAEYRTSVPHIFSVGDVIEGPDLTPVAIRQGHILADREFAKQKRLADFDTIPTAVFSTPEIGTVGLTQEEAHAKYGTLHIYRSSFRPMKATLSGRDTRMVMKLIVDAASERVVGCHIFGEAAAEIVQGIAIAMRMGATKADFDQTMALHPSAAEELVTMRDPEIITAEAAE